MVAATTPRLEFVPQVNLSRLYLFRANDALDAGRVFEAGCLLREAVRRQLYAECAWKGCLPPKLAQQRSPMALLHALKDAGHCGAMGFQWTRDLIEVVNRCAHCVPVSASLVRTHIAWWHTCIDNDPCGEQKDRTAMLKAADESCDCDDQDDDDSADWWKKGSV